MALLVVGAVKNLDHPGFICIGYLFCGIQPIVSTCMAMTKSDVRKYTRDLITISYVRKASALKQSGTDDDNDNERDEEEER